LDRTAPYLSSARSASAMPEGAAIDTDVLLKVAAYRLAAELVAVLEPKGEPMALGLTHLIAGRQLARKRGVRDSAGAASELKALLGMLGRLEPDEAEIALAADLATVAQEQGLPLDSGEAQLTAITLVRGLPLLVTGDKRGLGALHRLMDGDARRADLVGRLACFEQVLLSIAQIIGEHELRSRICAEPEVDGAMRLACSCGRDGWDAAQMHEACGSYVGAIRQVVGDLLVAGSVLA
jgi:hypothetical protein